MITLQDYNEVNVESKKVKLEELIVRKITTKITNQKSCKSERIYAELPKNGTNKLVTVLTRIVSECLNEYYALNIWKVAYPSLKYEK